jgi:hypothetical protein
MALGILLSDNEWAHRLSGLVWVLFTLSGVTLLLCFPVVRRWLAGNSGRARVSPQGHDQTRQELRAENESQVVAGSSNRASLGDYHERHEHHYHGAAKVHRETLNVTRDGENHEFQLEHIPTPNSLDFFVNGLEYGPDFYRLDGRKLLVVGLLKCRDNVTIKYAY